MKRHALGAVALTVAFTAGGGVAYASVQAADEPAVADCTSVGPIRTMDDGSQRIRTECVIPAQPTQTVTVTASPGSTGEPSATTAPESTPPAPTEEPTETSAPPSPPTAGFPTRTTTGTPPGWTPKSTVDGLRVTSPGQVVEDVRVKGDLTVAAKNVTLRRVEVLGRISNEQGGACQSGLRIEDSTVRRGTTPTSGDWPAVLVGSYSADNVLIDGMPEGFRVGGKSLGCGAVTITDSYANVVAPDQCGDWHGDGLQGYDAPALTLRDTVLILNERAGCYGTVAFFYPSNQGNTSVDIDGLVVKGGGFPFTLGMPGPVQNLHVVDKSWGYGPIKVDCSRSGTWDAAISTLDADGQPTPVRDLPCNTQNGD